MKRRFSVLVSFLVAVLSGVSYGATLVSNTAEAPHRGVYEIVLKMDKRVGNPYFDVDFRVTFVRPDRSQVVVDGFYDGGGVFKARAYCDTLGQWRWVSASNVSGLNAKSGSFNVNPSKFKGKLRKHPDDPQQFAYDNGEWFLHIGDTGYRYVTDTEPEWMAYIDQAAEVGFTKIRTWFCRGRSDVQALFSEGRSKLNLEYWREIDKRVTYALNRHPHIIFQLIPYGEDTKEIERYGKADRAAILVAKYAQARFSAFPNIYWCVSNDRHIIARKQMGDRDASPYVIDRIAKDMRAREPWGTLLTNHQQRFQGYYFVDEEWSDIITLEDLDQADGRVVVQYFRDTDDPVVLDEDRYECYRGPEHDRYFFRRLMWACLLSGGSATYGGLKTYEPYDGELRGVQGYLDAVKSGKLEDGAHDFRFIHQFFNDTGMTLTGMRPNDAMVGYDPLLYKCIEDEEHLIIYLQNPDSRNIEKANVSEETATLTIHLRRGSYKGRWFDPRTGEWHEEEKTMEVVGGYERELTAPIPGDVILYLKKK